MLTALIFNNGCDDRNTLHESFKAGEGVILFTLETENAEDAGDISIWVFESNGILKEIIRCDSYSSLADISLSAPAGNYDVVAAINVADNFTIDAQKNTTTVNSLLALFNQEKEVNGHFQFGKQSVIVSSQEYTIARISLSAIYASFKLSVSGLINTVIKTNYTIKNCASGYYPATDLFTVQSVSKEVTAVDNVDNNIVFPKTKFFPTAEGEDYTKITFSIVYDDGEVEAYSITAPVMKKGGDYSVDIPFKAFEHNVTIEIKDIDGWIVVEKDGGDIGETVSE